MSMDIPFTEELARSSLAELKTWWREALSTFMEEIGVPDRTPEAAAALENDPFWKTLASDWITLPTQAREDRFGLLLDLIRRVGFATRPECLRCGTCCQTSSPSLFSEDLRLFKDGIVDGMEVIIDALGYDEQLRPLLRDKLPLPAQELAFYFGRPLRGVIRQFGAQVIEDADGNYRIAPVEPASRPEGEAAP